MPITALQHIRNTEESNSFVGVFRYIKTSGVKTTKEGELYGFMQLSSEGEFPAERVASMAWEGVVEGYMYSKTKSISESLKSAIEEFTRRLKDLMRNNVALEQAGIDVSLVILVTTKDGVYLANIGENEIFAYKGGKVVNILDVLEKNKAQTAGFSIKPQDLVVVSTNSLLTENMHTMVGKRDQGEIVGSLDLLSKTLLPGQAMLMIHPDPEEVEEVIEDILDEPEEELGKSVNINLEQELPKPQITPDPIKPKLVNEQVEIFEDSKKKDHGSRELRDIFSGVILFFKKIFSVVKNVFSKIWSFVKNVFSKLGNFLKSKLGNKKWFKKYAAKASQINMGKRGISNLRIDGYKEKDLKAKRFKIVLLSALAIFVVVGGYQYARKQSELRELHRQVDEIFSEVEGKLESAQEKLSTDRDSVETYIYSAGNLLAEVPEGLDSEYMEKYAALEASVLGVEDDLYKRVVVEPESFVGFFDEGTELTDIKYFVDSSGNELLFVTDSGTSSVWQISIYDKSKSRVADNDGLVSIPEYVDVGNDGDLYVYDSDIGVLKASNTGSGWSAFEDMTGVSTSNIKVKDMGEFAVLTSSDSLYYLDPVNSRIVKSVNYGSGYSSTVVSVVNDDAFINANDFFADFSIYVLTSGNSGILRYSGGVYDPLTISGVNGDIGDILCGHTGGSMDTGLYVFDSGSKRVLSFEKPKDSYNDKLHPNELVLKNQYLYRGSNEDMWSDVKDIVVDKSEKSMYILDGNSVWRIGL